MSHWHESCAALCSFENLNRQLITVIHNLKMAAVMFQGPPLLKVGVSLGPHSIILDPSLKHHSSKQYIFGKNFGLASLSMYTLIILSKHTECFLRLLVFFQHLKMNLKICDMCTPLSDDKLEALICPRQITLSTGIPSQNIFSRFFLRLNFVSD